MSRFRTQTKFLKTISRIFILFLLMIHFAYFAFTLISHTLILSDLLYLSATTTFRILPPSYSTGHFNHEYSYICQILYSGRFTLYLTFLTHSSHIPQTLDISSYVPPTRRVGSKSSAFSDYAGDRADYGLGTHMSASCGGRALPITSLHSSRMVRLATIFL
ncbi:hypothetical protein C8F04DRAFT_1122485 [Mycena alexandri]|uniref:Uncharacterized protein n=1 Tax=Mycena alexandri TaxID=1745969 RepID=A0AAD6SH75_9AGAR|nr:hypothetical protein C8F04DRAFT_1122485 [Mycena alexandri]